MTDEREMRERAIEAFKCDMCAGSGQLMHYGRNHGPCHKCHGVGHDAEGAEKAVAFAASERDAERERCCRDVCQFCAGVDPAIGSVLDYRDSQVYPSGWQHYGHARYYECKAAAIRSRVSAKGEKA